MTSSPTVPKTEFADRLNAAWHSKIKPLRSPVFPQSLRRRCGEECIELAFLLSAEPKPKNPLVLRLKWADGGISASRDALEVEFGDWKHIPDLHGAFVEMDTFIADFECGRAGQ